MLHAFTLTPSDIAELDRTPVVARALVTVGTRGPDALIGDAEALVRFVRHDVLADLWSGEGDLAIATHSVALDVVSEGLRARWLGDTGASPWRDWLATAAWMPEAPDLPLAADLVRAMPIDAAVAATPATWALHMHDACWAVSLTGRERVAARAQLSALRHLFAAVGAAPSPRLVATVVAAVHASVVADVLDTDVYTAMTEPFLSLLP